MVPSCCCCCCAVAMATESLGALRCPQSVRIEFTCSRKTEGTGFHSSVSTWVLIRNFEQTRACFLHNAKLLANDGFLELFCYDMEDWKQRVCDTVKTYGRFRERQGMSATDSVNRLNKHSAYCKAHWTHWDWKCNSKYRADALTGGWRLRRWSH